MTTYQPQQAADREPEEEQQTAQTRIADLIGAYDPAEAPAPDEDELDPEERRRRRYGGVNWGAGFFGWLVTLAMTTLLTGVVAAALVGSGRTSQVLPPAAAGQPRVIGVPAFAIAFVVLLVACYSGGYVAGRMSRFDGGRQGAWVWVLGVMAAGAAIGAALMLGPQAGLAGRVSLPSVSVPPPLREVVGPVAAVVTLLCALLVTMAGGKVGCRYHRKVDQAAWE